MAKNAKYKIPFIKLLLYNAPSFINIWKYSLPCRTNPLFFIWIILGIANKNTIPFDPEKPTITSGIRVGTPAITTRGFKEDDSKEVARLIALICENYEDNKEEVSKKVLELCKKHPLYK